MKHASNVSVSRDNLFFKWANPSLFFCYIFVLIKRTNFTEKTVGLSRTKIRIVRVEGKHAGHLTTTTAPDWSFFDRLLYRYPWWGLDKFIHMWEPWSSGYGKRLTFWRSWVRILEQYTGWTFLTFICCKNGNDVCLKRTKINETEAGVGPFKKKDYP